MLVERVGVPVVEHAGTAREVALTLLGVAAEVEQALMVQYIYAAVSVSPTPDRTVWTTGRACSGSPCRRWATWRACRTCCSSWAVGTRSICSVTCSA